MDVDQFQTDLKREDIVAKVQQAWEGGQKIGLPGTPLILINGQIYGGPRDHTSLNDIIQLILLGKRQYTSCPAVTVQQNKQYIATLHTEKGDIVHSTVCRQSADDGQFISFPGAEGLVR